MIRRMLSAIVALYVVMALVALLFSDRLMFQPGQPDYSAETLPVAYLRIDEHAALATVHLANPAARYTILYSHGNAEDLGDIMATLQLLHSFGFAVVAYDYRGYGLSTGGRATSRKAVQDAETVYDYIIRDLHVQPGHLILFGRSIGSGPTMALASHRPAAGIVLESAFTSAFRVVTRMRLLPFDKYPNLANLARVHSPILIIHGTRDEIIPFAHGRQLYAAAPGPKQFLWVKGAHHNDLPVVAGRSYGEALSRFAGVLEADRR